jgi:uncharacterized protein involved in exopolysaccharide biosynthesis
MDPGWPGFWNIAQGGLVMRLTSIGLIPVGLALAGLLVGGVVAARTRELYRSSATVTLKASDPQRVRAMLGKAFGPGSHPGAGMEKAAWIRVAVDERGPAEKDAATRLVVASGDEDAVKAQRVTRQLVDLLARTAAAQAALEFETISAPNLPTSPSGPSRAGLALSCAAAGILLGVLLAWFRQRSFDQTRSA